MAHDIVPEAESVGSKKIAFPTCAVTLSGRAKGSGRDVTGPEPSGPAMAPPPSCAPAPGPPASCESLPEASGRVLAPPAASCAFEASIAAGPASCAALPGDGLQPSMVAANATSQHALRMQHVLPTTIVRPP